MRVALGTVVALGVGAGSAWAAPSAPPTPSLGIENDAPACVDGDLSVADYLAKHATFDATHGEYTALATWRGVSVERLLAMSMNQYDAATTGHDVGCWIYPADALLVAIETANQASGWYGVSAQADHFLSSGYDADQWFDPLPSGGRAAYLRGVEALASSGERSALRVWYADALGADAVRSNAFVAATVEGLRLRGVTVPPEPTPARPTSQEPSATPTAEPSASGPVEPSAPVAVEPTTPPSVAPTAAPSVEPTVAPSVEPTSTPSVTKSTTAAPSGPSGTAGASTSAASSPAASATSPGPSSTDLAPSDTAESEPEAGFTETATSAAPPPSAGTRALAETGVDATVPGALGGASLVLGTALLAMARKPRQGARRH